MNGPETVAIDSVPTPDVVTNSSNTLYKQQKEDIESMRSALLGCNRHDANSVRSAMRNILIMRVYHQIARIIRFTEEMDKIENKLYEELDSQLLDPEWTGQEAIIMLVSLQERMQKVMVESQKLLDPYLDLDLTEMVNVEAQAEEDDSFGNKLLSSASRQNIREGAQKILQILDSMPEKTDDNG